MMRWMRRLFWLGLLAGAGCAAYKLLARRQASPADAPQWSPPARSDEGATAATPRWVAPVDGACPEGYPVKANDSSHIYHVPGGRSYDRTIAERCYAKAEDAQADGYRPAKA